jgi:hypothetical protein
MRSTTRTLLVLAAMAAVASPCTYAVPLSFSFSGIAGSGSFLDLGSGPVDLSGAAFTASGQTINDVDLYNGGVVGDGIGFFAATTIYDFGALGSFHSDAGADFYGQNCAGPAAVSCALLSDVGAFFGWRIDFAPAVAGDPDFGIPLGTQVAIGFQIITRTQGNAAGDTLTITTGGQMLEVTANAVPEPATLLLLGGGLLGVAARRRRSS